MFDLKRLVQLPKRMVWGGYESPVGEVTILASNDGVCAIIFDGEVAEKIRVDFWHDEKHRVINKAIEQLGAYFDGGLKVFDLPLDLQGTDFQKQVWQLLLKIPFGQTRAYGDLARELGDVGASQAVGAANGNNPVSIVVPCHRVIGASGDLTGYVGGMDKKAFLLQHEGVLQEQLALF